MQQTLSNKVAFLNVLRKVSTGVEPWGYLFEDDVTKHELSPDNMHTLIAAESKAKFFQYLGICTLDPSVAQKRTCGRCAHAMGFSREGATELLRFAVADKPYLARGKTPRDEEYFDVIIEGWCHKHDGFMVFGPLKNSMEGAAGHWGVFVQDRSRYKSEIDQATN